MELDKIEPLNTTINELADKVLASEDLVQTQEIDAEIELHESHLMATRELDLLEPYGETNPEPIFLTKNLEITHIQPTSTGEHLRMTFSDNNGGLVHAMAFGMGNEIDSNNIGRQADVAYRPTINEFRGKSNLQWLIKDIQIH